MCSISMLTCFCRGTCLIRAVFSFRCGLRRGQCSRHPRRAESAGGWACTRRGLCDRRPLREGQEEHLGDIFGMESLQAREGDSWEVASRPGRRFAATADRTPPSWERTRGYWCGTPAMARRGDPTRDPTKRWRPAQFSLT